MMNSTKTVKIRLVDVDEKTICEFGKHYGYYFQLMVQKYQKVALPRRADLRDELKALGLNSEMSWGVAGKVLDIIRFRRRTNKMNVTNWRRDLAALEKNETLSPRDYRKKQRIESKIKNVNDSVVIGSKKLLKQCEKDSEARIEWQYNRLFLFSIGRPRTLGNDTIRIVDNKVFMALPKGKPQEIATLKGNHKAQREIKQAQSQHKAITAQIIPVFGKNHRLKRWEIHLSYTINDKDFFAAKPQYTPRVAGIDFNARTIDVGILDVHGNRVGAPKTFHYSSTSDIGHLVDQIARYLHDQGIKTCYIENLKGLTRRCTRTNNRASNAIVGKMPHRQFAERLIRRLCRFGVRTQKVNPAGTSKYSAEWSDKYPDPIVHRRACYLVARKGLGLRISRSKTLTKRLTRTRRTELAAIEQWVSEMLNKWQLINESAASP